MTPAAILAVMITMAAPGQSTYSLVPVASDAPAPCAARYSPLCRSPWYSRAWRSHVRVETPAEARERYGLIAEVVASVAADRPRILPHMLVTLERESRFRRDVHSGIGAAAKGDCRWRKDARGKPRRVAGSCRGYCLAQIHDQGSRRNPWVTARGYSPASLTGLSRAATTRCLQTAADALEDFYGRCHGSARCIFASYTGARSRDNAEVKARAGRLWTVARRLERASER